MKRNANNLIICAMLLGSMMTAPSMMAQARMSGMNGTERMSGQRASGQMPNSSARIDNHRSSISSSSNGTAHMSAPSSSERRSASSAMSSNAGRIGSPVNVGSSTQSSNMSVNNNHRNNGSTAAYNNNTTGHLNGGTVSTANNRTSRPSVNYWPGAATNGNTAIEHRNATSNYPSSSANNNRRPGNNGGSTAGNDRPGNYTGIAHPDNSTVHYGSLNGNGSGSTRPNNNGNHEYGGSSYDYGGGNYSNYNGRRPGNYGDHNSNRPYANNRPGNNYGYNRPGNTPGHNSAKYDRYRYDGHMAPRGNGDRFYWNYRNNDWARPMMPPARAYRPEHIWFFRPTVPAAYRPYYGAPSIVSILGVDFGTLASAALNFLYYKGYDIDGYYDNVVYLRNVPMLSFTWPDVMMSYDPTSGFNYAQFTYSTPYYDRSRYNRIYRDLCATYGQPISYGNGLRLSWYGGDGMGYVTLDLSNQGGRCYTSLSVGL